MDNLITLVIFALTKSGNLPTEVKRVMGPFQALRSVLRGASDVAIRALIEPWVDEGLPGAVKWRGCCLIVDQGELVRWAVAHLARRGKTRDQLISMVKSTQFASSAKSTTAPAHPVARPAQAMLPLVTRTRADVRAEREKRAAANTKQKAERKVSAAEREAREMAARVAAQIAREEVDYRLLENAKARASEMLPSGSNPDARLGTFGCLVYIAVRDRDGGSHEETLAEVTRLLVSSGRGRGNVERALGYIERQRNVGQLWVKGKNVFAPNLGRSVA